MPFLASVLCAVACSASSVEFPPLSCGVRTVGPGGGGYLTEIVASRHAPERVFVGCDVGGFYRSEDGGRTFRMLNAGLSGLYVNDLAEHPTDTNRLVAALPTGLCLSTDGGLSWRDLRPHATPFPKPAMYGFSWPMSRVVWCEKNPNRVWAGSFAGGKVRGGKGPVSLWRSDDAGETWVQIAADAAAFRGKDCGTVLSLSPNTAVADELLLTLTDGVYRSEDGGESWVASNEGLPIPGPYEVRCVERCRDVPNVVYVTLREQKTGAWDGVPARAALYRSSDAGRTWKPCGRPASVNRVAGIWSSHYHNESLVVVHPTNPDDLWATGPTFFLDGVVHSTDGGQTWTEHDRKKIDKGWIDFWGIAARPLARSPLDPRKVYFGTSGHFFATEDDGATWSARYSRKNADGTISGAGLETTCLRFMLPDAATPDRWYLGYWDIGLMTSTDRGRSLRRTMDGVPVELRNSCFRMLQAPDEPNRLWAVFGNWGGWGGRVQPGGVFAESTDRGASWTVKTNGWQMAVVPSLACLTAAKPHFLAAAALPPSHGHKAWTGLQLSADGGETWSVVSTNVFPAASETMCVASENGVLYVGTRRPKGGCEGGVWKSVDRGRTWTRLTPPDLRADRVVRLVVRGNLIVAAVQTAHVVKDGGGCLISTDGGQTWRWALEVVAVSDVALSPDGRTIALAIPPACWRDPGFSGLGVLISRDTGRTWRHLVGEGVDCLNAAHLAFDVHHPSDLWCGTGGNSVVVLTLPEGE